MEPIIRVLLDTSVIVAALVESHSNHERAFPWLKRAKAGEFELVISAHTIAEVYAVLTRLPIRPRIQPAVAEVLIRENILKVCEPVALTAEDYSTVVQSQAEKGLPGGSIYDAIIARVALNAKVDQLVTLNPADFKRVWNGEAKIIIEPE
ncbi:MAG: PIN domain-containing protein [Chloroflexota bacterium]